MIFFLSKSQNRIGAILLETIPSVVFQLGQNLNSIDANSELAGLQYVNYLATATGRTLDVVTNSMLTSVEGHRSNAQPIVLAMLGSKSQESVNTVNISAQSLHSLGAKVIVVENGMAGNALFEEEAIMIASQPSDIYSLGVLETALQQGQSMFEADFMQQYFCSQAPPSTSIHPTPSPTPSSYPVQPRVSSSIIGKSKTATSTAHLISHHSPTPTATFAFSSSKPHSSSVLISSSVAKPSPTPLSYCQFLEADVVFVLDATGNTGKDVFSRFVSLAEHIINLLPAGGNAIR